MSGTLARSGGGVGRAVLQAQSTGRPVAIPNPDGTPSAYYAYPNGTIGPQSSGSTPLSTATSPTMPVPPRPPYGAVPSSPTTTPAPTTTGAPTYTDPTTLQSFSYVPSTGAVVASGPGYGNGTVIPQTSQSGPLGSTGPVDRHDDPVAAQARVYRINHGLATADDSAATDALNAESLAAARAGRTSFNPQLAAQYGQAPAAGVYGPRTDVVNALSVPTTTGQSVMLAPTTTQSQQPINLMQYLPQQRLANTGDNLLAQGTY